MKKEKRSTVLGAALIIFALLLRLIGGGGVLAVRSEETAQGTPGFMRPTTGAAIPPETRPDTTVTPTASAPTQPETVPVRFTAEDLALVQIQYAADCGYRPDLEALLLQPLTWDLSGSEPTVLIVHTHASESFTRQPGQAYTETADYRTLDTQYNMVAVGDYLAELLTQAGICVLHDRQIHDYPSYTAAYGNSRDAVRRYLDQYPTIQVVLDLHRDAALNADGSQYATSATVNGETVAQLMLVVGTDASGTAHPNWSENLAAAIKLQVLLEKEAPGITRRTILRAQRFNHDLSAGAMIVEVGTAGNTLEEAMGAIPVLAQALSRLLAGTQA